MRPRRVFHTLLLLTLLPTAVPAEQYVAKNADWPQRLEELTRAREKNLKSLGFEIHWANEKVVRVDGTHEAPSSFEKGLTSEDQKDCGLREIKEVETFLKDTKYQAYLKERKVKVIWLSILDNTEGKLPDTQLRYGPELVREGYDFEGKFQGLGKYPSPVLLIRAVLGSKRNCVIPTYENLALSFDWWGQPENGP